MFCLDPQQGNGQAAPRRFPPLSGGKLVAQGRVFAKQVRELAEAAGGCLPLQQQLQQTTEWPLTLAEKSASQLPCYGTWLVLAQPGPNTTASWAV